MIEDELNFLHFYLLNFQQISTKNFIFLIKQKQTKIQNLTILFIGECNDIRDGDNEC
jgi:hypothetical protein